MCVRCASLHRGVGTHVSKVKGCTGTYLWGPDEMDRVQRVGNANIEKIYGGVYKDEDGNCNGKRKGNAPRITPDTPDMVVRQYIMDRYDKKLWFDAAAYARVVEGNAGVGDERDTVVSVVENKENAKGATNASGQAHFVKQNNNKVVTNDSNFDFLDLSSFGAPAAAPATNTNTFDPFASPAPAVQNQTASSNPFDQMFGTSANAPAAQLQSQVQAQVQVQPQATNNYQFQFQWPEPSAQAQAQKSKLREIDDDFFNSF